MNNRNRNKLVIIVLIAIGVAAVIFFLLYKYYAPFGKVVSYKFTSKLPGAQEATTFPASKDNLLTIPSQIIRTPQVRFTIKLLSPVVSAIHTKLRFKRGTQEIRMGVRGNEIDGFTYHPLYHSLLQDLNWNQISDNNTTLWQKEKTYSTIPDFVDKVSLEKKTASYYVDIDSLTHLKPSDTTGANVSTVINAELRGTHIALVRVDKAPLVLSVTKQDMNAYDGEDKLKIVVSKDGKILDQKTIEDDGIATASRLKMQPQNATVSIKDIQPGFYQIEFVSESKNSDNFISRIEINQKKIVFKNYIYVASEKPSILWTNADKVNMTTWHDIGKQTAKVNGEIELKIAELGKQYVFNLAALTGNKNVGSLYQLEFPKGDMVLDGEGYYVLNKDHYFDAEIIRSVPLTTLEKLDDIDYVLAGYTKAKTDGDWLVAETTFDPKDVKVTGDKLYFSLEMPDLAKYGGELEIDSLEIDVKSDGVLSKAVKEKKDEPAPASAEGKKPTIFSRFFGWVGKTATAVKNSITSALSSAWKAITGFFGGFFSKNASKPTPTPPAGGSPTPQPKVGTPSSTLKPSLTPTTTATPSAVKYDLLIRVLNGGGEKGTAASVAAILKTGGFTNVNAGNADRFDYAGVTIQYRKEDITIADKIETLLKKEYGTITKILSATTTAEAVVILGKK